MRRLSESWAVSGSRRTGWTGASRTPGSLESACGKAVEGRLGKGVVWGRSLVDAVTCGMLSARMGCAAAAGKGNLRTALPSEQVMDCLSMIELGLKVIEEGMVVPAELAAVATGLECDCWKVLLRGNSELKVVGMTS